MNGLTRLALVALTAIGIGTAQADWLNPERGIEVDPGALTLPTFATGRLGVQECATCAPLELGVTNETEYFLAPATSPVSLTELRSAFYAAAHKDDMIVYVFFDPGAMLVNRLVLDPPK